MLKQHALVIQMYPERLLGPSSPSSQPVTHPKHFPPLQRVCGGAEDDARVLKYLRFLI